MIDSYEKYRQVAKYAGGYFEEQFLELINRLEAAEKDVALKEKVIDALGSELNAVANEHDTLRAKIEAMEQQEPVYLFRRKGLDDFCTCSKERYEELSARPRLFEVKKLYTLPGAQAQPVPSVPREAIEKMLTQLMDIAVSNGANSVSMPDEYVEVAAWLCGIPAQPAPSINESVRKVTLDFRWESKAQHHIPTIEIEFEPVSPESPNDAKGWQDRDRIAAMLTPEAKPNMPN